MRKRISFFLALLCAVSFAACSSVEGFSNSGTGITALKLMVVKDNVELDAGDSKVGYFKVEGNSDFSIDDIDFVSSAPSVATIAYDKTALTTCVYYKINAVADGTATVYAQTKDGNVKTDEITVTVSGYQYDIADIDDISVSSAKRARVRATVAESLVTGRTDEQITDVMKHIAQRYADAHKINAVTVFLFIDGDDTSGGYTVGCCTYAPYGDIGRAGEVAAGDYTLFDFCDIDVFPEETRNSLRGK